MKRSGTSDVVDGHKRSLDNYLDLRSYGELVSMFLECQEKH